MKILVKNKKQIDENILTAEFKLIDARSLNRFKGIEKEPREGLRSGSIPNCSSENPLSLRYFPASAKNGYLTISSVPKLSIVVVH